MINYELNMNIRIIMNLVQNVVFSINYILFSYLKLYPPAILASGSSTL